MDQFCGNRGDALQERLAEDVDAHFGEVIEELEGKLRQIASRFISDPTNIEEVVVEAFESVYLRVKGLSPEQIRTLNIDAYLCRAVVNGAKDVWKKQKASGYRILSLAMLRTGTDDDLFYDPIDEQAEQPEQAYLEKERRLEIIEDLRSLSEKYRTVLMDRYLNDFSLEETAAHIGHSVSTTKSLVRRGLRLLRSMLDERK